MSARGRRANSGVKLTCIGQRSGCSRLRAVRTRFLGLTGECTMTPHSARQLSKRPLRLLDRAGFSLQPGPAKVHRPGSSAGQLAKLFPRRYKDECRRPRDPQRSARWRGGDHESYPTHIDRDSCRALVPDRDEYCCDATTTPRPFSRRRLANCRGQNGPGPHCLRAHGAGARPGVAGDAPVCRPTGAEGGRPPQSPAKGPAARRILVPAHLPARSAAAGRGRAQGPQGDVRLTGDPERTGAGRSSCPVSRRATSTRSRR